MERYHSENAMLLAIAGSLALGALLGWSNTRHLELLLGLVLLVCNYPKLARWTGELIEWRRNLRALEVWRGKPTTIYYGSGSTRRSRVTTRHLVVPLVLGILAGMVYVFATAHPDQLMH